MSDPDSSLRRRWLLSAALVIPCFWQSRIQAGDLSSHVYNSWLAELAQRGEAPGLYLAPIWTNIVFDAALSALAPLLGYAFAPKVLAALCALVFFWGAMAWVEKLAGARPAFLAPLVAMFTYGFVFHMGFFNFYLSFGLCLWAMVFAMSGAPKRRSAAALLAMAALLAHALPVLWAAGLTLYWFAARRLRLRNRALLLLAGLGGILAVRTWVVHKYVFYWSPTQIMAVTGADQLFVFEPYQQVFIAALIAFWAVAGFRALQTKSLPRLLGGLPAHCTVLHAAMVFLIPFSIQISTYNTPLHFVSTRMSLAAGLSICALVAAARPSAVLNGFARLLSAAFFTALFVSTWQLNRLEDKLEAAAKSLPRGASVVAVFDGEDPRTFARKNMLSRACLGHCFNYANYEPSTLQFRLRAHPGNKFVTASAEDSLAMQDGQYTLKPGEGPLYVLAPCQEGQAFCASLKHAGEALR